MAITRLCFALAFLPCSLCLGFLYAGLYTPFGAPVAPGFVPYPGPCLQGGLGCPAGPAYPVSVCPQFVGPIPPFARHACLLPRHCPLGTRCCLTRFGRRCLPIAAWW